MWSDAQEVSSQRSSLTREERLTLQFYEWERRGRGWTLWNYPVPLEPPFRPFIGHHTFHQPIDDGRKPTFLSSLAEQFKTRLKAAHALPAYPDELAQEIDEPNPPFFDGTDHLVELQLSPSPSVKVARESAEQFLLSLSFCTQPLAFEIVGAADTIIVQTVARSPDQTQLKQQLRAYFPDALIQEAPAFLESQWNHVGPSTVVVDFGLCDEFMLPVRAFDRFEVDPLIGVVGALSELAEGELGLLQVLFERVRSPWLESIMRSVVASDGKPFLGNAPEMVSLAKEKTSRPLFACVVRAAGRAATDERAWQIVKALGGTLVPFARPGSNELIPLANDEYDNFDHEQNVLRRQTYRSGMILNSEELLSLVHPPSPSVRAAKLLRHGAKTKAAPAIVLNHHFVLGENAHDGHMRRVTLSPEQRVKHTHIIGVSGSGKSTLLLNLIIQDLEQGSGVCVLDPHGDLIDQVLQHVPDNRFADVILLDPSDEEYPIGFNILSAHSELEKNLLSSDLVAVFRRLSTSWGDQMTSVLGNAILAFLESDAGGTLSDLRRFLIEPDFRRTFLQTVRDEEVVYFWQKEFPLLTGKPQAPLLTRLDTFLRPKLIRAMVSQRTNRLDFKRIMNEHGILLARLSQGAIGEENAYLLGTLLVSKLHQLTLSRQEVEASERAPFYLYIDEFQNFVTPSTSAILSGARKYQLGLVLAHQEFRQLWSRDQDVASAVISNPYTRICFRLGDFDAQKLADGFAEFTSSDFQNLGVGRAIARVERNEYDFNLTTVPPPDIDEETGQRRRAEIVRLSRERYGQRREAVQHFRPTSVTEESQDVQESLQRQSGRPASLLERGQPKSKSWSPTPVASPSAISMGRGGQQHKYLQQLIKRLAEDRGFKVTIEQPVLGGAGSVDVALERADIRIACEISVSSPSDYELKNIQKCLAAGFAHVVVVSSDHRTVNKIRRRAMAELEKEALESITFMVPEELLSFLEHKAPVVGEEKTVRGYRVKVKYQAISEAEQRTRKEAIGQTILQALKRLKGT